MNLHGTIMLDPRITELNKKTEEEGGIHLSRLKPGTRVVVKTKNSIYEMTVIEGNRIWLKGGKYFPEFVERYFLGSTWGGACLKLHWVGYDMRMEFTNSSNGVVETIRTSRVEAATICGDGWSFDLDWPHSQPF